MASAYPQLTGIAFANLLVLAGLACFAVAIFGWNSETIAASPGFRTVSALTGALLLFYVYGTYAPRAAHSNDAQNNRSAATRSGPTQQAGATRRTQPLAKQHDPSAPAAALSLSSSTRQPTTPTENSTTPLLPNDGRNGAPQQQSTPQQQAPQPSEPQPAAQNLFSGRWKNADPKAASILILRVQERGNEISVRAWGMCFNPSKPKTGLPGTSQYCDWGTGHGAVRDGAANVTWEQGAVLRRMRLLPAAGSLRVVVDSTYRDRRPPQHVEAHFAKSL